MSKRHGRGSPLAQGANGATGRAGGENESWVEQLGDKVDLWRQPKQQVTTGTAEYELLANGLREIPNTSITGESLQRLEWGDYYTYEQRWGDAAALTSGGKTYVLTRALDFESSYLGHQL